MAAEPRSVQHVSDRSGQSDGSGVSIVAMRRRHLRAVTVIEQAVNPHPWSLNLFSGELRMPSSRIWFTAIEGNDVLGFSGLMVTHDEAHITNIAVHPDHHRRGIGSRLLLALFNAGVEAGVMDVTLEVRASNGAAQAMYSAFGFAPGGIRRDYYQDNSEDAVIMWANDVGSRAELDRRAAIRDRLLPDPKVDPDAR